MLAAGRAARVREILLVAQDHHRGLVDAIERREGARAEAVAREHARLARRNLEIVLSHRDVLERHARAPRLIQLPDRADAEENPDARGTS